VECKAQGWYQDPYAIHEDRYLSDGVPTKLVRDDGQESYDPPPDRPLPPGRLVSAEQPDDEAMNGADLHRADEAQDGASYNAAKANRAAFDAFDRSVPYGF
jgi:hypothetical protein